MKDVLALFIELRMSYIFYWQSILEINRVTEEEGREEEREGGREGVERERGGDRERERGKEGDKGR